jgi:hypothetical protein
MSTMPHNIYFGGATIPALFVAAFIMEPKGYSTGDLISRKGDTMASITLNKFC